MANIAGGRLIVDALKREGVECIFSLAGGHIDAMYQACLDTGINVIDTRHEQAAAHMAEAWGRLTRSPGVCAATAGPGFTNAVSGIANAAAAGSPMLFIAGRAAVPSTEALPMQEMPRGLSVRGFPFRCLPSCHMPEVSCPMTIPAVREEWYRVLWRYCPTATSSLF